MSSQQSDIHNDYVMNPMTGRLLKKGSKTYKKLVTAKLLNDEPTTNSQDNVLMEADSPLEAKQLKSKLKKGAVGKNKVITTRGKKVLKSSRRPTRKETIDKVSDIAIESVIENQAEILESDMTDTEIENYIRQMIGKKLIGHASSSQPRTKKVVRRRPKPLPEPVYESDTDDGYNGDESDYEEYE